MQSWNSKAKDVPQDKNQSKLKRLKRAEDKVNQMLMTEKGSASKKGSTYLQLISGAKLAKSGSKSKVKIPNE